MLARGGKFRLRNNFGCYLTVQETYERVHLMPALHAYLGHVRPLRRSNARAPCGAIRYPGCVNGVEIGGLSESDFRERFGVAEFL